MDEVAAVLREVLTVLGVALVSSFLPVLNIEAYLVLVAATGTSPVLALAVAATLGQVAGKYLWFEIGRGSQRWPRLQRRLDHPRVAVRLERWERWAREHASVTGLVLVASASAGLPPFLVMSVVAGRLRVPRALFLATALVGRFVRFLLAAGLVDWLRDSVL